MQQKPDVLSIVESSVGGSPLLGLFLVAGFAGVDALEDAETPEVSEGDLEELESLVAGNVGLCSTFFARFLRSAHRVKVSGSSPAEKNFSPQGIKFKNRLIHA